MCVCLCHHLSIIRDTLPSFLQQIILPPVVLLRQSFLNITIWFCVYVVCVFNSVWRIRLVVVQDGNFGQESLEHQMFPALKRPMCVCIILVYFIEQLSWLPELIYCVFYFYSSDFIHRCNHLYCLVTAQVILQQCLLLGNRLNFPLSSHSDCMDSNVQRGCGNVLSSLKWSLSTWIKKQN